MEKAMPKLTMHEVVKNSVMMMNAFPPKSGINDCSSPRNIAIRKTLDCKTHCKLPFGNHAQVHQNEESCNGNKEQTLGAIVLGPIDDAKGGWNL